MARQQVIALSALIALMGCEDPEPYDGDFDFPTAVGVTLDLYCCREVLTLTLHCRKKKLDCRQMSSK